MSAYVCDHCHITALAAFAVQHRMTRASLDELCDILYDENVRSYNHRYPKRAGNFTFGECCPVAANHAFSALEIIKAGHCYSYQACEHDGWNESEAKDLVDAIVGKACTLLPGYEATEWGIKCPHDATTTELGVAVTP